MTKIYYQTIKGTHVFYMYADGQDYYLFSQPIRKGVAQFYGGGVTLDRAINHGFGRRDRALHRTMDKLVQQIRYIEQENDIVVLKKTKRN